MSKGSKIALWSALYLGAGVAYALINRSMLLSSGAAQAVSHADEGSYFFGYTGSESDAAWYAEMILTWPVAIPYGLIVGDPTTKT